MVDICINNAMLLQEVFVQPTSREVEEVTRMSMIEKKTNYKRKHNFTKLTYYN